MRIYHTVIGGCADPSDDFLTWRRAVTREPGTPYAAAPHSACTRMPQPPTHPPHPSQPCGECAVMALRPAIAAPPPIPVLHLLICPWTTSGSGLLRFSLGSMSLVYVLRCACLSSLDYLHFESEAITSRANLPPPHRLPHRIALHGSLFTHHGRRVRRGLTSSGRRCGG